MPGPTPTPSPGTSPAAPKTTVPLNSDGSVNLSGAAGVPVGSSKYSLWDIPQELYDYLSQISAGKLWFDVGKKKVTTETRVGAAPDQSTPIPVQTSTHLEPYNVMKRPEDVMAWFASLSASNPMEYIALQKALASGPWGKVNLNGVFDHNTEAALGNAMLQYVKLSMGTGTAMSFTDYLIQTGQRAQALGGAGTSLGSGGGGSQPFQPTVTDPTSIRDAAQNAAMNALGRSLSGDELDKFVAQFQASQVSMQQAAYTGQAGSLTQPDLTTDAMAFVQQQNPQDYQQNQRQAYVDSLMNLLSGGTVRPDIKPTPKV